MEQKLMIYETGGKNVRFNFDAGEETIWASRTQMAELFSVTPQNISLHLGNVYRDAELEENRTSKESFLVQNEGGREVTRKVKVYNLDAIISVGYRVNSRKATDFRIWATKVLKGYIVDGAAVNERRLSELTTQKLAEVNGTLDVVRRLMAQRELTGEEANGVLAVIAQYAETFRTLREYDEGFVRLSEGTKARKMLEAGECVAMIDELRKALGAGEMFGKLRGDEFEGILRTIYQSFAGEEMYPTVEEKAANLLYFTIKDHPFFDGNKRIGALMFVMFLTMNEQGLLKNGEPKISDRALTALTLMIAESEPREKGLMCAVVCRLLEE
jgi:prophage maintenance system killer protein